MLTTRERARSLGYLLLLSLTVTPAVALDPPKTMVPKQEELRKLLEDKRSELQPDGNENIEAYGDRVRAMIIDLADAAKEVEKKAVKEGAPAAVAGKTTSVTPAEGFPERVQESIADFLPLLGLSMDAVSTSEDRKSVTLKAGSLPFQFGVFNLTATAQEPQVFKSLAVAIAEDARDKEVKALLDEVDDLDDVTFAVVYGYEREGLSWETSRHLYGRNADRYQALVDGLLESSWGGVQDQVLALASKASLIKDKYTDPLRKTMLKKKNAELSEKRRADPTAKQEPEPQMVDFNPTFSDLRKLASDGEVGFTETQIIDDLWDQAVLLGVLDQAMAAQELDALPSLIDNQPQLVFTLAQRASNKIIGPESTTLTARYEMGTKNFNAMLREYRRLRTLNPGGEDDEARLKAYDAVLKGGRWHNYRNEDKFILALSYKWVDDYTFEHPYEAAPIDPDTGEPIDPPIQRTASLSLPKSEEFRGSLTFTRFLRAGGDPSNQTGVELPRFTFSLESIQLRDDPNRQNRTVAKLSYLQPASKGMSIPFTLTWASRSEFVGDQDRTFGAHLGISFKLD